MPPTSIVPMFSSWFPSSGMRIQLSGWFPATKTPHFTLVLRYVAGALFLSCLPTEKQSD